MHEKPQIISNNSTIKKGVYSIGLMLSDAEINALKFGKSISLEDRELGEIGSLFIMVSAISKSLLGKYQKTIIFRNLLEELTDSAPCSGIPIYSWNSEETDSCYLYLTVINDKLAIRLGSMVKNNSPDKLMVISPT